MAYCPLCRKKFQDRRALQGHFRFKHKVEYETGRPAKETAFTRAIQHDIERRKLRDTAINPIENRYSDREIEVKERKEPKEIDLGDLDLKW